MTPALAHTLLVGHAVLVAVLSVATLCTYAVDKRRAKRGGRRVSERTLHRLAWLGGAPGGWLGRRWLRHKTRKRGFAVRLALATVLHLAIAATFAWVWLTLCRTPLTLCRTSRPWAGAARVARPTEARRDMHHGRFALLLMTAGNFLTPQEIFARTRS